MLTRYGTQQTYTFAAEASAKPISLEGLSGLSVETTQAQTLVVYGCNQDTPESKTFVEAHDEDGAGITYTAAGADIFPVHHSVFQFRFIKLVDAGGGTGYLYLKA